MNTEKIAYAIWPWGTQTREQMEQAAQDITDVGFRCFESVKAAIYAYDMNLNAYREVLDRYNLKPVSFYFNLPQKEARKEFFSNLEAELEFVAKLGVKLVSLQAPSGRPDMEKFAEEMEYDLDQILSFANIARKFDITTCLHPHFNSHVMMENEIDYVFKNTSSKELSLVPDTAHLLTGGCDPLSVINKYIDRIAFTHLKDFRIDDPQDTSVFDLNSRKVYSHFVELGEGSVDFKSIIKALDDAGYTGYHCIESDIALVSNKESAKQNFDYICSL